MKKFVVILNDKQRGTLNKKLLFQHVEYLRKLKRSGNLQLCGPFKDDNKAMMILVCHEKEETIKMVNNDPFVRDRYYASYEIYEWIEANKDNNWLVDTPQTMNNINKVRRMYNGNE
ncbi:YciI family protein [Chengkuizengella axinellae]|uniref:YciI family protein n=1 Tax=Chengkuizengella axinellae TaxID=3064388 RepID=A0ABT9J2D4_9BACL|nr:YciI family protein [Chengkuizengella sp. 2205SS18-9]MDP5275733.1 YciI family protein [Chengkuizengella sp. 2205SS18-9]